MELVRKKEYQVIKKITFQITTNKMKNVLYKNANIVEE